MRLINLLKSRRDTEEGFTLIELMVVVLIIAILIAIAIPTFIGARTRAQDRAAQSDLRNALTAEKTFYTDAESYSSDVAAGGALKSIEPSIKWGTAATTDLTVSVGSVTTGDNSVVCLQKRSRSGKYFALADVAVGGDAATYYHSGSASVCTTTVATLAASPWKTTSW